MARRWIFWIALQGVAAGGLYFYLVPVTTDLIMVRPSSSRLPPNATKEQIMDDVRRREIAESRQAIFEKYKMIIKEKMQTIIASLVPRDSPPEQPAPTKTPVAPMTQKLNDAVNTLMEEKIKPPPQE